MQKNITNNYRNYWLLKNKKGRKGGSGTEPAGFPITSTKGIRVMSYDKK